MGIHEVIAKHPMHLSKSCGRGSAEPCSAMNVDALSGSCLFGFVHKRYRPREFQTETERVKVPDRTPDVRDSPLTLLARFLMVWQSRDRSVGAAEVSCFAGQVTLQLTTEC